MFYVICKSLTERTELIKKLKENEILSVFHYLSLHKSPYVLKYKNKVTLPYSESHEDKLLRLPLYYDLSLDEVNKTCHLIKTFFNL